MENNITDINSSVFDTEEYEAMETEIKEVKAQTEASGGRIGVYVHKFKTPLIYDGTPYEELNFDFDSLNGQDVLDIDYELESLGYNVAVRELHGRFQISYAAKACKEPVGSDLFMQMRAPDFFKISRQVKSFLLLAE